MPVVIAFQVAILTFSALEFDPAGEIMTAKRIASAKIARPSLSSVVTREGLYVLFDERSARPIV
jgi:hypothetical protein